MIASLPMYDTAVTRSANDKLWESVRTRLGYGPALLDRETDPHETWLDPELLLSQTCGLPYRASLHSKVSLVGTPDYGIDGCPPGYYRSQIVVAASDTHTDLSQFRGAIFARNDVRSQSGWAAMDAQLGALGTPMEFFGDVQDTGGHAASAQAVAEGRADIACLDAVTWRLLCRDTTWAAGLRVLTATAPTPGLPFITSDPSNSNMLFHALEDAIAALSEPDRACLMLRGLVKIPDAEYRAIPLPRE